MGATDFNKPEGLSPLGEKAYTAIMEEVKERKLDAGGCKTFYSPEEWRNRGEDYGQGAELIIVYDGGDLRPYFSMDAAYDLDSMVAEEYRAHGKKLPAGYVPYRRFEEMGAKLRKLGMFVEQCTGWYSAVYKA